MSPLYIFDQQEVSMSRVLQSSLLPSTPENKLSDIMKYKFIHSLSSSVFVSIDVVAYQMFWKGALL
jgi:hypothetical protein